MSRGDPLCHTIFTFKVEQGSHNTPSYFDVRGFRDIEEVRAFIKNKNRGIEFLKDFSSLKLVGLSCYECKRNPAGLYFNEQVFGFQRGASTLFLVKSKFRMDKNES